MRLAFPMIYREIGISELDFGLFASFIRRQIVTDCWRRDGDVWVMKPDPFIDDWAYCDYRTLIGKLSQIKASGGFVYGAFSEAAGLKGFAAVDSRLFGSDMQYMDLAELHVSSDMRRRGIGSVLFSAAVQFASSRAARKLYISAHSACETISFYRAMGCTDAVWHDPEHVRKEPYDLQLEYDCNEKMLPRK